MGTPNLFHLPYLCSRFHSSHVAPSPWVFNCMCICFEKKFTCLYFEQHGECGDTVLGAVWSCQVGKGLRLPFSLSYTTAQPNIASSSFTIVLWSLMMISYPVFQNDPHIALLGLSAFRGDDHRECWLRSPPLLFLWSEFLFSQGNFYTVTFVSLQRVVTILEREPISHEIQFTALK